MIARQHFENVDIYPLAVVIAGKKNIPRSLKIIPVRRKNFARNKPLELVEHEEVFENGSDQTDILLL